MARTITICLNSRGCTASGYLPGNSTGSWAGSWDAIRRVAPLARAEARTDIFVSKLWRGAAGYDLATGSGSEVRLVVSNCFRNFFTNS
jgi:hypothetical protein